MPASPSIRLRTDLLGQHGVDGEVLAHVAEELEHADRGRPAAVVDQQGGGGAGLEVEQPPQLGLMASTLSARTSSSSRLRSSERPLGSPIMPVAPPARAIGRWPASWNRRSTSSGHQVAHVQAVGGGVEAGIEGDRPGLEPLAQGARVGGVVDQPAGGQVVEDRGVGHPVTFVPPAAARQLRSGGRSDRWSRSPWRGGRRSDRLASARRPAATVVPMASPQTWSPTGPSHPRSPGRRTLLRVVLGHRLPADRADVDRDLHRLLRQDGARHPRRPGLPRCRATHLRRGQDQAGRAQEGLTRPPTTSTGPTRWPKSNVILRDMLDQLEAHRPDRGPGRLDDPGVAGRLEHLRRATARTT